MSQSVRIVVLCTAVLTAFTPLPGPMLRGGGAAESRAEPTEPKTRLEIAGSRFAINGEPVFLYGISYYGALGASRESLVRDLDDMQRYGFNWIRVWATWSAFDNDVSAVDNQGRVREHYMGKLKWLVAECDRRGMIVDVTLTRGEGRLGNAHVSALDRHAQALETLASELKVWRNWYLDMANEHNIRSKSLATKYVSVKDARMLRDSVKKVDESRLVTISYVNDISKEDTRRYLFDVKVDFLSPHRPRNPRSASQTAQTTRQYLTWMNELSRVAPVHYQEPFRRDFSKGWQPTAEDFAADLRGAIQGGAAGWCFHNGDNRWAADAQPRRSFDMRNKRLFEQLDAVERQTLKKAAALFLATSAVDALSSAKKAEVAQGSLTGRPYPPSPVVKSITWQWNTHQTAAIGSDLWPVTWASDGHLYAAWGDGGGFGGTNSDSRVSMGFARIAGPPERFKAVNVNGGKNSEHPASFPRKGKTGGILCVDGTLYARLNMQNGKWPDVDHALAWSDDLGKTWRTTPWVFPKGLGNFKPSRFLNFGKDYTGAPKRLERFVFVYGFKQQPDPDRAGHTYLARAPRTKLKERSAYEFFSGFGESGAPRWSSDVTKVQPAFSDPNGASPAMVTYNLALKRYLLTSYHGGPGKLGIFDGPEPWGPWTTVAYYDDWGNMGETGHGLTCDFPQKWMSADGLTLWCVFSVYGDGAKQGVNAHDKFNLVKATLTPR